MTEDETIQGIVSHEREGGMDGATVAMSGYGIGQQWYIHQAGTTKAREVVVESPYGEGRKIGYRMGIQDGCQGHQSVGSHGVG